RALERAYLIGCSPREMSAVIQPRPVRSMLAQSFGLDVHFSISSPVGHLQASTLANARIREKSDRSLDLV
ncbi:MAG: hypothetical protein P8Y53_01780, partial [Pseudolabrys sp.]